MVKTKLFYTLLLIFIFAFRIWQATGCSNFHNFRLNPLTVKIKVEEQRNLDNDPSGLVSKVLNNKLTLGVFERAKVIFSPFEINYLISILSPIGLFALVITLLNLNKKTNKVIYLNILYVLISASLSLVLPPNIFFYNFAFSLFILCLWSVKFINKSPKNTVVFSILAALSIVYLTYNWQMPQLCDVIFFN